MLRITKYMQITVTRKSWTDETQNSTFTAKPWVSNIFLVSNIHEIERRYKNWNRQKNLSTHN